MPLFSPYGADVKRPVTGAQCMKNTAQLAQLLTILSDVNMFQISIAKLIMPREYHMTLIAAAAAVSTTSLTPVNYGGYLRWSPTNLNLTFYDSGDQAVDWYFEASIASANVAATATCILRGVAPLATLTSIFVGGPERKRSASLAMPVAEQDLWVTLQTSNATYAASLWSARLIGVPRMWSA